MDTLTLEQVASLLGITVSMAAQNERMGTLPFVRFGDGFISTHAAAVAVREDKNFLRKRAEASDFALHASERQEAEIARAADAKRAKEKAERDAANHAAWVARAEREAAAKAAQEAAMTAGSNVVRA